MNKKLIAFSSIIVAAVISFSFIVNEEYDIATLRKIYSSGDNSKWPKANVDAAAMKHFKEIGILPAVVHPADNPNNEAKKELGKLLFYDPRLSVSGQIACASCHDPQLGWGDGKRVAFGHDRKTGGRNAMTIFNTAFYEKLFWDGRAHSLEDQAQFPVADHLEMNQSVTDMEKRIQKFDGYKPLFAKAFSGDDKITADKIFKAIACFERSIVSPPSRFDLFIKGKADILKDEEVLGLHVYRTKANCMNCHNGGAFTDNQFHNDGQTLWGSESEDLGLYNVTKKKEDVGKFKTPSLRESMNTGPWFHHGNFPTMKDVIFFYNLGNPAPIQKKYIGTARDSILPTPDPLLRKLNLTEPEINALVAFMGAITTIPKRLNAPVNFPK
jgi:cytochrome c peroxidase